MRREIAMKWVEIITLRSPTRINTQFVDELVRQVDRSDTPEHLIEIRTYHHSVVETDLSIHIYWTSESGTEHKSALGQKFSYALKNLGLLNHSVWVETAALEVPLRSANSKPPDTGALDAKTNTIHTGPKIARKVRF
jgi:hypothetical protein